MIFSELYSVYYNTVAKLLRAATEGNLTEKDARAIVEQNAFSESLLTILPSLKSEKWQLLKADMTTPIQNPPTMPLTILQKRWLKAILLDPRMALFGVTEEGLEDVEPLFTPDDFVVYDKYCDGDPFTDEDYIRRFRLILDAIKEGYPLRVAMINRRGQTVRMNLRPTKLEYSEKDDKFRMISVGCRYGSVINLGRMTECARYYGDRISTEFPAPTPPKEVVLTVTDERNALERVMLHFAHFEKQAERLDGDHYRLKILYDGDDETELVIRVLSFGPLVKVEEPQRFTDLIRQRLRQQMRCNLK